MKREMLKELGLTDEAIDRIMAENGRDIEKAKGDIAGKAQELEAKEAEIAGLTAQIRERDKDIKDLRAQNGNTEELNTKLAELQAKYDADTANFAKQIDELHTDHAIEKFFAPIPFASELARKAAVIEFKSKGFKLDNGKFQGGDAFITELKQADPAAFKPEETPGGQETPPQFTRPLNQPPAGPSNPFSFNFAGVRQTGANKQQ